MTPRALERRLKRHLRKAPQHFMAVCAMGLEPFLAQELRRLGAADIAPVRGGVEFSGPLDLVYTANLELRTAHRVLLRISTFLARSLPMLYDRARRLPWELYLGFSPAVSVNISAKASRLQAGSAVATTLYQAILARLGPLGLNPALSDDAPLAVAVRLFQDRCTLSLNTSGHHLHQRGYRLAGAKAPLRETLAAGIALACDATQYDLIVDPMCGSGTLLIEAGLLAASIPPGKQRTFAFEAAPFFQPSKWQRLRAQALASAHPVRPMLWGSDRDAAAVRAAQDNAALAGVPLTLHQGDALKLPYESLGRLGVRRLLVCNLPYGKRVSDERRVARLLKAWVAVLHQACQGWDYALLSAHPHRLLAAGLVPKQQLDLDNGGIPVSLLIGTIPTAGETASVTP